MASRSDDTRIAVVGVGYVGVCLTAVLAEAGRTVRCIDTDVDRVKTIESGQCPISESRVTELFEHHVTEGDITATEQYDIGDCGTVIVTVGTPLSEETNEADLSGITAVAEAIGETLRRDQLVVFRSTVPPGTTETVVQPILESESGLTAGEEFSLAFCPERMAEGSAYDDLTRTPVVVGGIDATSGSRAAGLWESLGVETVQVSDPTTAELSKLADNWWIDLNIALANELALLSERVGVDAMEVIEASNTLPKGEHNVNILYPGAGVGGSCLLKDPWFVADMAREHGLDLETPRVSRRINNRMPGHLLSVLADEVDLDGSTVAVLGYAFKAGTDDTRNTPATEIVAGIRKAGGVARVTDPYVPAGVIEAETGATACALDDALDGADAVAIVTGHRQYRGLTPAEVRERLGRDGVPIVDGRDVFDPARFDGTGLVLRQIGNGRTFE